MCQPQGGNTRTFGRSKHTHTHTHKTQDTKVLFLTPFPCTLLKNNDTVQPGSFSTFQIFSDVQWVVLLLLSFLLLFPSCVVAVSKRVLSRPHYCPCACRCGRCKSLFRCICVQNEDAVFFPLRESADVAWLLCLADKKLTYNCLCGSSHPSRTSQHTG